MDPKKIDRINELAKSKGSKLWTKKETMLHQRNYVKSNVKKDYMVVVSMTQIHNKYSFF